MRIPIFPYFDVVGTNCYIVTSDKVLCYDTTTGKETDELTALTEQICSDDNLVYRNTDTGLPVTFAKRRMITVLFLQIIREFSTIQQVEQLWRSWYRASRLH